MENILNFLQSIFQQCDEKGSGVVETNKLVDQLLTSQSWQDQDAQCGDLLKEEFHKLLKVKQTDGTHFISKDDFINSLLKWFQKNVEMQFSENIVDLTNGNENQDESPASSGETGEASETYYKSSSSSVEDFVTVYYVPKDESLSRQDYPPEDSSVTESESPNSSDRDRILESEMTFLKQRNDYLESLNSKLRSQVSALEDDILNMKNDFELYSERVSSSNDIIKAYEFKLKEAEERLLTNVEEDKLKTITLGDLKRENCKLKGSNLHLEKQNEYLTQEKLVQSSKVLELQERIESLSKLHVIIAKEKEDLRATEMESNNTLTNLAKENDNLKLQLESRDLLIQELELERTSRKKAQSGSTNREITSDTSADNSVIFSNENSLFEGTIPFQNSLFAELHDEVNALKNVCKCSKRTSSSSVSTMTDGHNTKGDQKVRLCSFTEGFISSTPKIYKDVGVGFVVKNLKKVEVVTNKILRNRVTGLPVAKCIILFILVVLVTFTFYALGVLSSCPTTQSSRNHCYPHCLASILEMLGIYKQTRLEVVM